MKTNKNRFFIIVSFVFTVLSIAIYIFLKKDFLQTPSSYLVSEDSQIDNFCLSNLCLSKIDNNWFINQSIPAQDSKVDDFLKKLSTIKLDTIYSNNPDNFSQIGFDQNNPFLISIDDKKYLLATDISNIANNLLKLEQENIVYSIPFIGYPDELSQVSSWQLSYIQNIPQYQIKSFTISLGSKSKSYSVQEEGKWPQNDILDSIAYLKTGSYLENGKPESKNTYQINISLEDNSQTQIYFGQSLENIYWASADNTYFFNIEKTDFDKLTSLLN